MSLITSGEFGFEREVIEKSIVEEIPIPPFESLEQDCVKEAEDLFARLNKQGGKIWPEVDAWVAKLYGLGERDLTVICDTLQFNLPYAANREMAQSPPSTGQINIYCERLKRNLPDSLSASSVKSMFIPLMACNHRPGDRYISLLAVILNAMVGPLVLFLMPRFYCDSRPDERNGNHR